MADDPTANDIQTSGLKYVLPSSNGKIIRVVFSARDNEERAFQIPTDAVEILLPFLAKAAQEGKRISGNENEKQIFPINDAEIGVSEEGNIVFDFVLPEGAQFAFQMDPGTAQALLTALQLALGQTDVPQGSPKHH